MMLPSMEAPTCSKIDVAEPLRERFVALVENATSDPDEPDKV